MFVRIMTIRGSWLAAVLLFLPIRGTAQTTTAPDTPPDSLLAAAVESPAVSGPIGPYLLVGGAYSQRRDTCALCSGLDDDDNFTGHLRVGRHLGAGLGLGLDLSVWKRSRTDVATSQDLTESSEPINTLLGNLSLSANYRFWQIYLHAGGGLAYGSIDVPDSRSEEPSMRTASGVGIGYSAGGGIALPMAGQISLVMFANWNVGRYDLISEGFTMAADVEHRFLEIGLGLGFN